MNPNYTVAAVDKFISALYRRSRFKEVKDLIALDLNVVGKEEASSMLDQTSYICI